MRRLDAHIYPEFVSELDMLTPEDVVWEPYSPEAVATPCTSRPVFALLRECEPVAYYSRPGL